MVGARPAIPLSDCRFPEPCLIWLLPGWGVHCGICNIPRTISRHSISSSHAVGAGAAVSSSIGGFTTAGTIDSVVPYILSLSRKYSAASPHPSCVDSSNFISFYRNLSMHCCTVLEIVPITRPGSSSWLRLPCSVSPSSSPSPSSPSLELARSLRLTMIATIISSNLFSGSRVVNSTCSAVPVSSCSCLIAASAPSTSYHATVVSLSTYSSIHFAFSSLLKQCIACRFSAASFFLHRKLHNAPRAWNLSASKPLLPSFTWWRRCVDHFVELLYSPAGSGTKLLFGALTDVVWVDFVVGRDVVCCKIWTIWRQAASFRSRLECLLNLNKAKSAF